MNKTKCALFALMINCVWGGTVPLKAGTPDDVINVVNSPLCRQLSVSSAYTGVLADSQVVDVQCSPRGLIAGLSVGLTNALLGTDLCKRKVRAYQYVVRLDSVDGYPARTVTIWQRGDAMIPPGSAVFVVTDGRADGRGFSARVIHARTPECYGVTGLEESRLAGGRK